jgi:hypothetical protein
MDSLKGFIVNIPNVEKKVVAPPVEEKKNAFVEFFRFGSSKEKEPEGPVAGGPRKEDLFVDLIEKVTLLMDSKVGHYWPPFTSVGHSQKISD